MRLIIVSNRAPVNIIEEEGTYRYEPSSGGLASGLRAYVERLKQQGNTTEIIWIGWPGAAVNNEEKVGAEILERFGTQCVFLSNELMENFYEGFCNKTIWPLFHYFPSLAVYEKQYWEDYITVNKIFADAIINTAKPDDVIWIHDYHLMLAPAMVREKIPNATIGFFLHIPFPSYEIFRLLPSEWRKKILQGLYGSDLIGFHTHDYRTYFLRSVLRILGLQNHTGEVLYNDRITKTDTFPMGIDYEKYASAVSTKSVKEEKVKLEKTYASSKIILSIDRQDYSKGILNRLRGYEHFLQNNPEWKQKVIMIMVVVPSRIGVESYQSIKSSIDELVGSINGKYGTLDWMPIVYQYRSLSFDELIALYNSSDVALVTPLRDGMNLIAKEYLASRTKQDGVLILSEMAGAVDELAEALIVNPNNTEEISDSLLRGLEMKSFEQTERVVMMQQRLASYTVFKWADDFLTSLNSIKQKQKRLSAKFLNESTRKKIMQQFKHASSRLIFLDYDGTLTPYKNHPDYAVPDSILLNTIHNLSELPNTQLIIVTGRDRLTIDKWLGHLPINLIAEHGLYIKEKNKKWELIKPIRKSWKKKIIPVLHHYIDKLPGSFVEEKEYSVVFHYRRSDPSFAALRMRELTDYLQSFTLSMDVQLLRGNKVLEIRNAGIDKGVAALHWISKIKNENTFILAAGDDTTDEDLFRVLPKEAHSIKVGYAPSYAKYNLKNSDEVIQLLTDLLVT